MAPNAAAHKTSKRRVLKFLLATSLMASCSPMPMQWLDSNKVDKMNDNLYQQYRRGVYTGSTSPSEQSVQRLFGIYGFIVSKIHNLQSSYNLGHCIFCKPVVWKVHCSHMSLATDIGPIYTDQLRRSILMVGNAFLYDRKEQYYWLHGTVLKRECANETASIDVMYPLYDHDFDESWRRPLSGTGISFYLRAPAVICVVNSGVKKRCYSYTTESLNHKTFLSDFPEIESPDFAYVINPLLGAYLNPNKFLR